MKAKTPNEEIAFRIVKLYFEEVARLGFKRGLDLDSIMNAYYYTLYRLENHDDTTERIKRMIEKEERALAKADSKEDLFPVIPEEKK